MHEETPFRIVLFVVFVVQTAISAGYLIRSGAAVTLLRNRQAGPLLTGPIVLSYVAYAVCVVVYLIHPGWMTWSAIPIPAWARWLAVVPLVFGGVVIVRGLQDLGRNLTISPSTKDDHQLVTMGAYAWMRHPLYSGLFVESVGVCVMMANWFVSVCAIVFCGLVAFRTRIEEDNLIAEFGEDYRAYQQRVGQFVPKFNVPESWFELLRSTPAMLFFSLITYIALAAMLFGLAGTWKLPWFWLALAVFVASHLSMLVIVFRRDPDLAIERVRPGPGEPTWDKRILGLSGAIIIANLAVSPLDVGRYHWSDSVPVLLQVFGLIGIAAGLALMIWSMAVNTFFSKVVRIQKERGHRLIQSGPYHFVRHPGYLGYGVFWTSFNFALGSWLAVGVSLLVTVVLVVRTALEDRFLLNNLDGYTEYAQRVKWRLLPGIW